jgi:hypothetical protein
MRVQPTPEKWGKDRTKKGEVVRRRENEVVKQWPLHSEERRNQGKEARGNAEEKEKN